MLCAVLLDVGGTLWPNDLPGFAGPDPRLAWLQCALPDLDASESLEILNAALREEDGCPTQETDGIVAATLRRMGAPEADAVAVRRALCVPASAGLRMFADATALLEQSRALGLRTVIVSNVQTRGAMEYLADFAHFGLDHLVDAVVTSLDVGYRKPHHAMFEAALREARCSTTECVMIGDSETSDIEPAKALGMRAIRVAIEQPRPANSAADAIATNLREVAEIVTRLSTRG
jgi:HAD superfamily hydrolase (TIGR01662 family)